MKTICFDAVTYRYPDAPAPAIRGITFDLEPGELSWFFGASGAGASTILALIAGVAPRHLGGVVAGRIRTLGVDPASSDHTHGRTAFLLPEPRVQLSGVAANVWEEVAYTPANLGWAPSRIRQQVDDVLVRMDLVALTYRDPATLSGGETQRVVLAALAATQPDLWLLDEPTTALDGAGRAQLASLLRYEAQRGAAVIIASEDADLFCTLADRCLLLHRGRVLADGPPKSILQSEQVWECGAGSTSVATLAREVRYHPPHTRPNTTPVTEAEALAVWRR